MMFRTPTADRGSVSPEEVIIFNLLSLPFFVLLFLFSCPLGVLLRLLFPFASPSYASELFTSLLAKRLYENSNPYIS